MKGPSVAVLVIAGTIAGCGASAPGSNGRRLPCSALQTLGVHEREGPARALAPVSPTAARCFTRAIVERCSNDEVATMPRGTPLDEAEEVCWIALDQPACFGRELREVFDACGPRDLSLVVPWEADCAEARRAVGGTYLRQPPPVMTASTALALTHAAAVAGNVLSSSTAARLDEASHAERSPEELQLLFLAQACQRGAGSGAMGVVDIAVIECVTYVSE